jgi:hypothetical protein
MHALAVGVRRHFVVGAEAGAVANFAGVVVGLVGVVGGVHGLLSRLVWRLTTSLPYNFCRQPVNIFLAVF